MGTEPVRALLVDVLIAGGAIGPLGICGALLIVAASCFGQAVERRHRLRVTTEQGDVDRELVSAEPSR